MVAGQVGVLATAGIVGAGIRWWTHSPVNHAIFDVGDGWCVSAEPHGAALRRITDFPPAVWSEFVYPTDTARSAAILWALNAIGTPYGFLDDAALAIVLAFGWSAPQFVLDRLARTDRLQCAQLCDLALQAGNIHAFDDGRPPSLVWPGLFYTLYRAKHWAP
ncbi:MAG: hypothetical protein ACHQ16_05530 [Candidatus Lutacidiplasmatales archaeon]